MLHFTFESAHSRKQLLIVSIIGLSLSACGPSEKQIAEERQAKEKAIEISKIEGLESRARDNFKDPASTQFRRVKLIMNGSAICGEVNSKNGYGAYAGYKTFAMNSHGKIILFETIPPVEVKNIAQKSKAERTDYITKYSTQFAMMGDMQKAVKMKLELSDLEEFSGGDFSIWTTCFSGE